MAWEKRAGQYFYYRSRKEKGRVVREYLGRGPRALRVAVEDSQKRTQRDTERLERKTWEALESQISTLDRLVISLSQALLIDSGLYRHNRGEWRRRRKDGRNDPTIPTTP